MLNDFFSQVFSLAWDDNDAPVRDSQDVQVLGVHHAELADLDRGQLQQQQLLPQLDARGRRPPRHRLLPRLGEGEGVLRRPRRGCLSHRSCHTRCQPPGEKQVSEISMTNVTRTVFIPKVIFKKHKRKKVRRHFVMQRNERQSSVRFYERMCQSKWNSLAASDTLTCEETS